MKYLVLIQARCGSSRLPNKVMKDLCGKPVLQRVIERVQKSKYIDEVMVVTSIEKNNLELVKMCADLGIRIYIGSENDVLDRYYQAAKLVEAEYIIRVTADCPLFDWKYLDMTIDEMESDSDYIWQATESYPDGLDIEIMTFAALKESWENAKLSSEREHVTQYIRKNPVKFKIQNSECPIEGIGNKRWTLDEDEDFVLIDIIYKHFIKLEKEEFLTEDILQFLSANPQLENINCMHERNEGLQKSLANDYLVG